VEGGNQTLALTVHGPLGSIDLLVPSRAVAIDVAREYADQAGLESIPVIFTRLGEPLAADLPLVDGGVGTGDVLVAGMSLARPPTHSSSAHPRQGPARPLTDRLSGLVLCVASGAAVIAGWFAALDTGRVGSSRWHMPVVDVLLTGAVLGVLPFGRHRQARALAAPAFAGAAAFALAGETDQEKLPIVLGMAGLAAAVAAAVARALHDGSDSATRVWIVGGGGLFVLTVLAALFELPPRVTWSLVLVLAMLAARVVPAIAVDVPDGYLIDMDRLAITAWPAARERPRSRRSRVVVPEAAVVAVAERGAAIITASSAAVLIVAALCSPLLLRAADLPVDRVGAQALVVLCGGGLLLSARNHRHIAARQLLRLAGLACWTSLAWALLPVLSDAQWLSVAGGAVAVAAWLVPAAVAIGRGWRAAWWARRAELAESLCTAAGMAALVVSAGFFRLVWESMP
jgi:hypothetical protein